MAFNFNWSPLIADTERARDMLTTALNKSPKPPIIVDDIIVHELNLGSTPPELEILEIGDLAEDRFKGIFKMRYNGDAYLTLKTRVQANPLNTYLSTKPGFASPETVAASSGLTIPLQITLSEIRLNGFVILVFSKQKGITTVFRNDPLEGLKVSSTFDSIPFVRDYLQRTIESQLRVLFMEDLPSIIHRLSLRVFNPEAQAAEYPEPKRDVEGRAPVDPFSSPPQQTYDNDGWPMDDPTRFSLHSQDELYPTFSQKNLLRLAALTDSQRTLSLFTPNIRDTVYRAWASSAERTEAQSGMSTPLHSKPTVLSMSNIQSSLAHHSASARSSVSSQASENGSLISRPTMSSMGSSPTVYTLSSGKSRPHGSRKRKNRIVNLRKNRSGDDSGEGSSSAQTPSLNDGASVSSGYTESAGHTTSNTSAGRAASSTDPTTISPTFEREGEVNTPERSPQKKKTVGFQHEADFPYDQHSGTIRQRRPQTPRASTNPLHARLDGDDDDEATPRASQVLPPRKAREDGSVHRPPQPRLDVHHPQSDRKPHQHRHQTHSPLASPFNPASASSEGSTGGILENAWMMKMQHDVARKIAEEKAKGRDFWRSPSGDSLMLRRHHAGSADGDGDIGGDGGDAPIHTHQGREEDAPPAYTS
ncbi:hypothetical protein K431DRAFT_281238 [Polychaeton citri CBS 116435]|uniref:Mitochondrial distribution and morphology protein 34 n=1 Tax=Polychaeton citri CBS 116435 TaxID=1314669 RepID=A0A9P4QGC0_9PEZI|nr:hypothetical protein K431DRAFT_281238 [Polychaeton citri CBS 116435]